jgi:hypothetical protein
VSEFQPYQLSLVPRSAVEDQFAKQFTDQFATSVVTTARELAPGGILPSSEVALDLRKNLGLRDRESLSEFEAELIGKGTPIAPRKMGPLAMAAIALFLLKGFNVI